MEIALTGFRPRFNTVTTDANRQRQQQDVQRQSSSSDQRESERQKNNQKSDQNNQARAQARQKTPAQNAVDSAGEKGRVINGEVLSSETVRVNRRESSRGSAGADILFSRRADSQQAPLSGQPSNRKIPVEQALQTFRDNESLVLNENSPRQVSGIIDEYV